MFLLALLQSGKLREPCMAFDMTTPELSGWSLPVAPTIHIRAYQPMPFSTSYFMVYDLSQDRLLHTERTVVELLSAASEGERTMFTHTTTMLPRSWDLFRQYTGKPDNRYKSCDTQQCIERPSLIVVHTVIEQNWLTSFRVSPEPMLCSTIFYSSAGASCIPEAIRSV